MTGKGRYDKKGKLVGSEGSESEHDKRMGSAEKGFNEDEDH